MQAGAPRAVQACAAFAPLPKDVIAAIVGAGPLVPDGSAQGAPA